MAWVPPVRLPGLPKRDTSRLGLEDPPLNSNSTELGTTSVERHHQDIGAVLSDVRMPIVDGITLARTLALAHPDLPIALMSTQLDMSAIQDLGNVRFWFVKPFDTELLVSKVGKLLEC
jgi:DNA-binding NtrC family response regulator